MNRQERHKQKRKMERKQRVKHKLTKIRENLRLERKKFLEEEKAKLATEELVNGKKKPIINDLRKIQSANALKDQEAKEQLEKNLKILEALEEEYDREQKNRQQLNEKLESEGHFTLKEKLDALHKANLEKHDASQHTEHQETPQKDQQ